MVAFSKILSTNPSSFITPKVSGALVTAAAATIFLLWKKQLRDHEKRKKKMDALDLHISLEQDKAAKKERAAVDGVFFRRLMRILKILIPGLLSPETGYLLLVACSLIVRTYCDVWMIHNGTVIERSIISGNFKGFKDNLLEFTYAMPLISIVNNLLKYGLNMLKLRFRTQLTLHLTGKYLSGFTYYKMSNLDNRIANADQLLTQDVDKFCNCLAELYSNLSKPLLDIIIYVHKLSGAIGMQGPAMMLGYLALSGIILTRLRRPVGKMTVEEQHLEGEFRYVNSRLITNSEEVAFYQGNQREKVTIESTFGRLVEHLKDFVKFRFSMGIIDNIIAKYVATICGFYVVSRPFLSNSNPKLRNSAHDVRMEDYYRSGRMLVKMAEAIGRLVLAGREMTRLAGFTARVSELMDVLKDLNRGVYQRTLIESKRTDDDEKMGVGKKISASELTRKRGEIIEKDYLIRFEKVPLVTPNGDVLVDDMTFEVGSGMNVLVCGPNGCGKSSLFRILGELWPLFGGKVTKPNPSKLFYIPQRPYMTLGTLRDQVIYPDTKADQDRKGISDKELEEFLTQVQLSYILEREGGWNSIQDWMDVLSGGEKQRIAMARLFYHKPQFAILDECTSAVSVDVEGFMYTHCREVGISLFTVSHRKSLWKYHEYVLYMDGRGSYQFNPMDKTSIDFGS
ncbi:ATP-binding cassette sub-family D member 3-like [Actinia tenebrosa]|uniref:ATP-binding cassette sub-family D member 3-like n=1 Tax=Actinia tenebrosa TaxID=6105 RepID=A0A6P8HCT3_ACTTE|nr:ATP-binding cassette sub-family D member 3-like [Actinia tenebrosa]XP_031550503.1 ATP-binding cassette sub-family D member 3-like [Actinia tenebrosa]